MSTLSSVAPGHSVRIRTIGGTQRLVSRLSSVGLIPGSVVEVRRNDAHRPVLVFGRDTLLAISRPDCAQIACEEVVA